MDNLRGTFESGDSVGEGQDWDEHEDEENSFESPPHAIGQDERRMQVRAYNHWAGLLGDRTFPSIEDLEPHNLDDFGPNSVLLDFSVGIDDPAVQFIGDRLGEECGATDAIDKLSDVPPRSLLSRITDHYMQILANQAPIGFEAEFVNLQGAAILYRGILLPFSSNDETIDFIYGVINWKEIADQVTSDELLLEIDQALEGEESAEDGDEDEDEPHKHHADPVTEWADSPAGESGQGASDTLGTDPFEEFAGDPLSAPVVGEQNDTDDEDTAVSNIAAFDPGYDNSFAEGDLPLPDFGQYALEDPEEDENEESEDAGYSFASLSDYLEAPTKKVVDLDADRFDPGEYQPEYGDDSEEGPSFGDSENDALSPVDPVEAGLFADDGFEDFDDEPVENAFEPFAEDAQDAEVAEDVEFVEFVEGVAAEDAHDVEPVENVEAQDAPLEGEAMAAEDGEVEDVEAVGAEVEDVDPDAQAEIETTENAHAVEADSQDAQPTDVQDVWVDHYDPDVEAGSSDQAEIGDDSGQAEIIDLAHFAAPPETPSIASDFAAFELTEDDILEETDETDEAEETSQTDHDDGFALAPAASSGADVGLYDCLALARDVAESARASEDRSRSALYAAVGRAYDVSLAAEAEPEAYAELLEDNGLVVQDRAPMTPVVKLVFGAEYDKTRITEYATVLSHAHRQGVERGRLERFLAQAEGGLKGVVAAERRLRREEAGMPVESTEELREKLAHKLRQLEAMTFDAIAADGAEFSLVMVRRDGEGEVSVIGEIDDDIKLIERAARKLVG